MSISLIQAKTANNSAGSLFVTLTSHVTTGDLITIIDCCWGPSATCTSMTMTDTLSNTYSKVWSAIQSPTGGTNLIYLQAWYCISASSGSCEVKSTTNGASLATNGHFLGVGEFSGFSGTATLDQEGNAASGGSATMPSVSLSTTLPNEVIFALSALNDTNAHTPTWNSPFLTATAASPNMAAAYAIVSSTGTYDFGGSWSGTIGANTDLSVAFSVSAGASGGAGVGWTNKERNFINKR